MLALLGAVTGCARDVAVTPADPSPSGTAAGACAALAAALPAELLGHPRRTVVPDSPTTAAWGDPPIVLRCGVARPAALQPTSQLVEVDGVAWLPEQLSAGYRFTTADRVANVEVTVPAAYAPEVEPLVGLGPAVAGAVRTR